jgi:hypothetical protein
LSVIDEHTRECLSGLVERSITADALAAGTGTHYLPSVGGCSAWRYSSAAEVITAVRVEYRLTDVRELGLPGCQALVRCWLKNSVSLATAGATYSSLS